MIVYSLPYSVVGRIVALSVIAAALCLSCSVMTPIPATKLAGQYVALDVIGLLMPTLQDPIFSISLKFDVDGSRKRKKDSECEDGSPQKLAVEESRDCKRKLGDVDLGWSNKAGAEADCSQDDLLCIDLFGNCDFLIEQQIRYKVIFDEEKPGISLEFHVDDSWMTI
ncbi:hypothetical protein Tco_0946907 [Tanacetum coccineum]